MSANRYRTRAVAVGIAFLVAGQIFQPRISNPPIDPAKTVQAVLAVPPDVNAIFERSCKDCHSNATTWPWYSRVSPASWLVVSHVNDGRDHLNLSEWGTYDAERVDHELDEICEHVREGEMPLTSYTLLHGNAKLSPADVSTVCAWTERLSAERSRPQAGPDTGGDAQKPPHDDSHAAPHTHGAH